MKEILASEWTKIRTVRSTFWTLPLGFVLSVGISLLIALEFRVKLGSMPTEMRANFDPVVIGFSGLTYGQGQLALVVFGVLSVSTEYTSGMIRASLAAVPRRGLFYSAKVLAGTLVALGVSLVTVPVTFFMAQAALGRYGTSLGAHDVLRATLGEILYLTLLCAFAMGVAAMLRSSALSLGILIPLLFLGSQGLANVPYIKTIAQYLPDQAGTVMTQVVTMTDPRFSRDYGPWTALAILVTWTAAALLGGYLTLRSRDA